MFCPNCGARAADGARFCQYCGTQLSQAVYTPAVIYTAPAVTVSAPVYTTANQDDNMIMLQSIGSCSRSEAIRLLQTLCGYNDRDAADIIACAPITFLRNLPDRQSQYIAQAMAERGMEVSIYDGRGWRDLESASTSVWSKAGKLLAGIASALGLIGIRNRITRDMIRRSDYPFRFNGPKPPVFRLHSVLQPKPVPKPLPPGLRPSLARPKAHAMPEHPGNPRPFTTVRPVLQPRPQGPQQHGGHGPQGGPNGGHGPQGGPNGGHGPRDGRR